MHDRVEELVLELSEPLIHEEGGTRRAQAKARLIYHPADTTKHCIEGKDVFVFRAPIGPIEKEELTWYIERYHLWPAGPFKNRAQKTETNLPVWGKAIYDEVFGKISADGPVLNAWKESNEIKCRFTVSVNYKGNKTSEEEQPEVNESSSQLLSLPWELMNDGNEFLFRGSKSVQVRRQLPGIIKDTPLVSEPPIRILLVSPRPDDGSVGYIDHRISAIPLLDAVENLGGLVEVTLLTPATYPDLKEELANARQNGKPYHVIHFDGHGGFSQKWGTGGLCFEDHLDSKKAVGRRMKMIHAKLLGDLIKEYNISLFVLEACQSAMTEEDPTASVAGALLKEGAASVVAMSYSVLVETARRFMTVFYTELAKGARIGDAMQAGHIELFSEKERGKIRGAGQLELQDWFVPVLYQEKDVMLFKVMTSPIATDQTKAIREASYGELKKEPDYPFTGRSRELLRMERLLEQEQYLVICGQGGEGKTTIASELGRWLVRTNRFERAVFVCVEDIYDVRTVVDRIGRQLVENYTVAQFPDEELMKGPLEPIEDVLRNTKTLIILDNMESILQPWGMMNGEMKDYAMQLEPEELALFFQLCEELNKTGNTRLIFTSRESIPSPFDGEENQIELGRLSQTDAIKLVTEVMAREGIHPKEEEPGGTPPNVEALVEAVNGHARSLVLLAPYIGEMGVNETKENIERLMVELDRKYPNEREKSLFACVEMSLRRLSPWVREAIKPLAVFKGGGHFSIIQAVLELDDEKQNKLVDELLRFRLVEEMPYNYLRFHPALTPYLLLEITEEERAAYTARWVETMWQMSAFLYEQRFQNTQVTATLTLLQLPNLMALLEYLRDRGNPEQTLDLITVLELLFSAFGRKQLLAQVVSIRETESTKIIGWNHIRFNSTFSNIERLIESGQLQEALDEAQSLLEKCTKAGETAYPEAAFDTAMACFLIGRILQIGGANEEAFSYAEEAYRRFHFLGEQGSQFAARMASVSIGEKGNCLLLLGRLEESAEAYKQNIKCATELKDQRQIAVGKGQLGTVRMHQGKWDEALSAYHEAFEIFVRMGEPSSVATILYQIGVVHEEMDNYPEAEDAYRQALSIRVQHKLISDEATSLGQLGLLYKKMNRLEEAVVFFRQAVERNVELHNLTNEGHGRNNLAGTLLKLKCFDEARQEILRAIECYKPFGHSTQSWTAYDKLSDLERVVGNEGAAIEARAQAYRLYLSYRQAGGENHNTGGKICTMLNQLLTQIPPEEIGKMLKQRYANSTIPDSFKLFLTKLLSLLAGERDESLWNDPKLEYSDAVELLLLKEKLEEIDKN